MKINKKLIKYSYTSDLNNPKYIVIHDTDNKDIGANAEMHYKYFNSYNRNASAHFFVDSTQILQLVEVKDKSWHCGDGRNKYGIGNHNSISVEICVNSDDNYNIAILKTIALVKYLMITYSIDIEHVVRHYDASRKNCPASMNKNGNWNEWILFKKTLIDKMEEKTVDQWKVNILKELHELGLVQDYEGWLVKLDKEAPVWMVFALILNLYKKLK